MDPLEDRLASITEGLQEIRLRLEALTATLQPLVAAHQDHEQRLREVEKWQTQFTPILSLAAFIGGAVFEFALARWL